jgi:hypothetical protein
MSQTTRETLTNAKIIEMVRVGLGEALIIKKIKQSTCQCDTSTTGLAKLKAAKVTDAIISAMMGDASGWPAVDPVPPSPVPGVPKGPNGGGMAKPGSDSGFLAQIGEPGVYLNQGGKLTAIDPTIYSGTKTSFFSGFGGLISRKIRAVVRGKSANFQTSAKPEFYFKFSRESSDAADIMAGKESSLGATSPAEFVLVAMKVKLNSREAILGEISAAEATVGTPDRYVREFSFERVRPGIYRVFPKSDLQPGEYCFYYVRNLEKNGKLFDFSVR